MAMTDLYESQVWHPERDLKVGEGKTTCLGIGKKGGCKNPISQEKIAQAQSILEFLSYVHPSVAVKTNFFQKALVLLFCHLHANQADQIRRDLQQSHKQGQPIPVATPEIFSQVDECCSNKQASSIIDQLRETIKNLKEQHEQDLLAHTNTQSQMAAALDEVKQRAEERGRIAIKQREELLLKLEQVSQQNAELESRSAELQSRNAELESRNTELESRSAELESRSAELESRNTELESRNTELESRNAELESRNTELEPGHMQDVVKPETSRRKLGCPGPQAQKGPILKNGGHERNDRSLDETGPKSARKQVQTDVEENLEWFESINQYNAAWKDIEDYNPQLSLYAIPWPVRSGKLEDVKENNARKFFSIALSTTYFSPLRPHERIGERAHHPSSFQGVSGNLEPSSAFYAQQERIRETAGMMLQRARSDSAQRLNEAPSGPESG
ncbi:hypothetical protein QBC46DRAFT_348350 [Diplogelasinospora grovesii]|uniref:Uncharacterized protein n=1 Tax=Diplogelasinospora grovesii TaxID=303347 RepID=A0AAN6MVH5_9PEZI|nr:hypothetical protein QBC46DRAFT_348350 [Diplogelasinospora grovesii]